MLEEKQTAQNCLHSFAVALNALENSLLFVSFKVSCLHMSVCRQSKQMHKI